MVGGGWVSNGWLGGWWSVADGWLVGGWWRLVVGGGWLVVGWWLELVKLVKLVWVGKGQGGQGLSYLS